MSTSLSFHYPLGFLSSFYPSAFFFLPPSPSLLRTEPRASHMLDVLVTCPIAMTWEKELARGRTYSGSQFLVTVHYGEKSLMARAGGSRSPCIHSKEAERDECWYSAPFLLLSKSGSPAHGMVLLTVWWVCPPQLTQSKGSLTGVPRVLSPR